MTDKTRICFVDDEPNILQGLKRFMRPMADEWEMEFHLSGDAALFSMIQNGPFDVVVSDMRMPGMDGAALLTRIRQDYPQTVRVILSGYADNESILRTIGPAHSYLAKPCNGETLRAAIRQPLALRRLLSSDVMRRALGGLESLPSLPDLFIRLDRELHAANSSTASVARIIGSDTAMSAEILKLTNSAYFGIGQPVNSVLQAVRTLGLETIQTVILKTAIFRRFSGSAQVAPFLDGLNRHGLALTRLAKAIALSIGSSTTIAEAAGCAALLSNIGALVLLDCHGADYPRMLGQVNADVPVHQAEINAYGVHHGHVGAYLLGLWGFADRVVEAVAHAPAPSQAGRYDNDLLTIVHLARSLGPAFPPLPQNVHDVRHLDSEYLSRTGLVAHLPKLTELAQNIAAEVSP
ncbi:response regulator [Magnetospirillum sulfuroxidans]|uniref:HDOD domain-containing protein n=1 Tax=Magnetospirillum sulfuroxidans TaxID=611300 RepID=A0ABS5IC04_9PROT|nr:response regulator [Magnetospirillum sulfuroxidans]MBR9971960.1 HDOD domain-containing protein [Magnetospirillum sulfuroxidans]